MVAEQNKTKGITISMSFYPPLFSLNLKHAVFLCLCESSTAKMVAEHQVSSPLECSPNPKLSITLNKNAVNLLQPSNSLFWVSLFLGGGQ